jgi:zinc transport system substrate-binding protein
MTAPRWARLLLVIPVLAGANPSSATEHERLTVVVSVLPQTEVAERVGGDRVDVFALVPPGAFPATYEPTPKQMAGVTHADLWLRIGIPLESAMADRLAALAPDLTIIDGVAGLPRRPMVGPDHGHDHGAVDPHVWLDATLVARHAAILCDALCTAAPDHCAVFGANLAAYQAELTATDQRLAAVLAPLRGEPLFVFHPAYGYLAERYGLVQVPVEVEGKVPTGRRLASLVELARSSNARSLFVQPQFAGGGARAVAAAMGVGIVEIDPLAPDLTANLERMAAAIVVSVGDPP